MSRTRIVVVVAVTTTAAIVIVVIVATDTTKRLLSIVTSQYPLGMTGTPFNIGNIPVLGPIHVLIGGFGIEKSANLI